MPRLAGTQRSGGGGWGDVGCVCVYVETKMRGGGSQGFTGCLSDWQTGALPPKQTHA